MARSPTRWTRGAPRHMKLLVRTGTPVMALLMVTCEHATCAIPAPYRALFAGQQALLATHRGFDLGALILARRLAKAYQAPLFAGKASRLLIDLNRSLHHPRVFSPTSRALSAPERQKIVERYYLPHRQAVTAALSQALGRHKSVLHVSVHSFTPVLNGEVRQTDLGLLFDPRRPGEVTLARGWKQALKEAEPRLRVRFNYPYRGTSDGFTTALRRQFGPRRYVGMELEINQGLLQGPAFAPWVATAILRSLPFAR